MNLTSIRSLCAALALSWLASAADAGETHRWSAQVEEDWLRQVTGAPAAGAVTTRQDAAGGCDGVKNGKYAFHTGQEANPWWQVDLGEPRAIGKVIVYNRLDYAPGLHNADNLNLLTSDNGKQWTLRHENKGRHFGGVSGEKPLEITFTDLRARFVRLQIPSQASIFFHLDEVEVHGPEDPAKNIALHKPCDQSSLSQWSTAKVSATAATTSFPIADVIARGRKLAGDLKSMGIETQSALGALNQIEVRAGTAELSADAKKALYLAARGVVRELAFSNPLLKFGPLLFVKRFTQETYPDVCLNHMPWTSRPGGDICVLSKLAPDADVRPVINGQLGPGHVHGMDLWFDGDRVVFGYAKTKTSEPPAGWLDRSKAYQMRRSEEPTHIFEIGIDGKNLRQITKGEWSDLDPTYLPSGEIAFVSERCGTSLQCNEYDKDETSCNLYVMRPNGTKVRRLSVNKDGDYLPHCLDTGMIGYTRWEYHERSWAFIQSIWIVRPDGTAADSIFKQHFVNPWALEDARSIPESSKLVAIACGHHTLAVGPLVVCDPSQGNNQPKGISILTPDIKPPEGGMDGVVVEGGGVRDSGGFYSTPWALSEKYFLVSYSYSSKTTEPAGYGLYLVDVFGNKELIYRDPAISCFMPVPLRARTKPPVLPDTTDSSWPFARCALSVAGAGSEAIADKIKYVRIAEPIGWPYDIQKGGLRYGEDHRYGGKGAEHKNLINWTPVRILGDVPVERDGSAHFIVPADTAVYFQLLDENRMELRRMRSFISFQPGETRACFGCHESRDIAAGGVVPSPLAGDGRHERSESGVRGPGLAHIREPSVPEQPPWGERPVSFLADVQPVLDHQCVRCHSGMKAAGGIDLYGGLTTHDKEIAGYGYNRAFDTILERGLVVRSQARAQDASITPPMAYGSQKSKLITALTDKNHVNEVKLSEEERLRLVIWIDANAPYHDQFVDKRPEKPAYDLALDKDLQKSLRALHDKRCADCHGAEKVTRTDWIDIHKPERSLFLTAPLSKAAGGTERCGKAVYAEAADADYKEALKLVSEAVKKAWEAPRRDLKVFARK
ncbi:MAG TPA: discoidin domain-containing protein [Planctomycetota bacterium]|jgi:hypothetical protein